MAKIHNLKTVNPYFQRVSECAKSFELRLNDRDYQTGDKLLLQEYIPDTDTYTGNELLVDVSYILHNHKGLEPNYVIMAISVEKWITP